MYSGSSYVITNLGDADVVRGGVVTPGFFSVFKAPLMMGRDFTADENRPRGPRALIVSHAFWQERLGGRTDVLSQSIEVSGTPTADRRRRAAAGSSFPTRRGCGPR